MTGITNNVQGALRLQASMPPCGPARVVQLRPACPQPRASACSDSLAKDLVSSGQGQIFSSGGHRFDLMYYHQDRESVRGLLLRRDFSGRIKNFPGLFSLLREEGMLDGRDRVMEENFSVTDRDVFERHLPMGYRGFNVHEIMAKSLRRSSVEHFSVRCFLDDKLAGYVQATMERSLLTALLEYGFEPADYSKVRQNMDRMEKSKFRPAIVTDINFRKSFRGIGTTLLALAAGVSRENGMTEFSAQKIAEMTRPFYFQAGPHELKDYGTRFVWHLDRPGLDLPGVCIEPSQD
jgi:hypothetical protein